MPVTKYVDSKFNGLVTVAGLSGDVATVINGLTSSLATEVTTRTGLSSSLATTNTNVSGLTTSLATTNTAVATVQTNLTTAINNLIASEGALQTLSALKSEILSDDSVSSLIITHLNTLETIVHNDVITLKAKDGTSNNYQISTQGDTSGNDSLFISKGSVPLMELSTRGIGANNAADVVTFNTQLL